MSVTRQMQLSVSFLLYLCAFFSSNAKVEDRGAKFFPLISFPHGDCRGDGGNNHGVCYSSKQCSQYGGRRIGSCAYNYGTCCSIEVDGTAGPTVAVTRNLTTIVNPPSSALPRTSHFTFPRQRGVCQLKLTFDQFQLSRPNRTSGNCLKDYMRITGSVTVDSLQVCGRINPNEHMYLDYGQGSQIDIVINMMGGDGEGLNTGYKFRVTQIPCESATRVPQKCLQYFRNETARVTSFNFPDQQLNNQQYTVCVEQKDPNANLQWSPCPIPMNADVNWRAFSITGITQQIVRTTRQMIPPPPPGPPPSEDLFRTCGADFVEFYVAGKFCNPTFTPITTPSYEMFVHFDATEPLTAATDKFVKCMDANNLPQEPGYLPWIVADPDTTPVMGEIWCVAKPLSSTIDSGNLGFCLQYTSVQKRTI